MSALWGWVSSAFLLLAGVWWINLFNFMDWIDDLAGQQAVFMLVAAAVLIVIGHPETILHPVCLWMAYLAAATVGFLFLNWVAGLNFMGDVGSTYLASMVVFFSLASVLVADATVTLLRRMVQGER